MHNALSCRQRRLSGKCRRLQCVLAARQTEACTAQAGSGPSLQLESCSSRLHTFTVAEGEDGAQAIALVLVGSQRRGRDQADSLLEPAHEAFGHHFGCACADWNAGVMLHRIAEQFDSCSLLGAVVSDEAATHALHGLGHLSCCQGWNSKPRLQKRRSNGR